MREIPLTQGKVALVDDDMYEYLMRWKWCACKAVEGFYYAVRAENFKKSDGRRSSRLIRMHRVIAKVTDPKMYVDHINHATLDNQRANLRICTPSENRKNSTSRKGSTSDYLGVSWCKAMGKWRTQIYVNGKVKHIGVFNSEIIAATEYNKVAAIHHGEFANLNTFAPQPATMTAGPQQMRQMKLF